MQDFTRLKVWQRAHAVTLGVYKASRCLPKNEQYGLTSQMRRAAASVPANIAEGSGSRSSADFAWFLQMAMRSASELQYHLILARDLDYVDGAAFAPLTEATLEVKRMLSSLISKVIPNSSKRRQKQLITDN